MSIVLPAPRTAPPRDVRPEAGPAVLCVHFTSEWDEYSLWINASGAVASRSDLRVSWHQRPSGILWGEVCYRQTIACDAILLDERHLGATWQHVRDLLRAEGVPRQCAAILARLTERPLLTTIARGPALSSEMVRRVHATLLGDCPRAGVPCSKLHGL